jgi:colanic acid/amylovoran biosynthesis glycosyltransferase
MRIAVVILEFPSLNETFVLDHITGLIDRGHDVDVYATAPLGESKTHEEIDRYNLLARTVYRDSRKFASPRNRLLRVAKALPLLGAGLLNNPTGALNSLNVFRLGRKASSLTALYDSAPFLTRSGDYDIVHCHFPENGQLAVTMRDMGIVKGKILTSFHGYNFPYFANGRMWRLYDGLLKKGDLFLACSEHMKRWFDGQGWNAAKTIVHRNAVRLGLFPAFDRTTDESGEVRLLSVGRFVEKKGFKYGVMGVAKILRRFPNLRYDIVGDGREMPAMRRLIAELGVEPNVGLLGWRDRAEILRLYQRAHLFLAPSVTSEDGDQEGIPVVLHEAMASGLPVISTLHTGIPELVDDGESGLLVPEKDPEAIADRLAYLMEHPERWNEMGRKGRKHIEEHNNIDKQIDRLTEIYRLLLEDRFPFPRDQRDHLFDSCIPGKVHG